MAHYDIYNRVALIKPGQLKMWQTGQEGPTRVVAFTVVERAGAEIGTTLDQGKGCENELTNQPIDLVSNDKLCWVTADIE